MGTDDIWSLRLLGTKISDRKTTWTLLYFSSPQQLQQVSTDFWFEGKKAQTVTENHGPKVTKENPEETKVARNR